jgi:hypothetical protein
MSRVERQLVFSSESRHRGFVCKNPWWRLGRRIEWRGCLGGNFCCKRTVETPNAISIYREPKETLAPFRHARVDVVACDSDSCGDRAGFLPVG